jgi:hypothetical protein
LHHRTFLILQPIINFSIIFGHFGVRLDAQLELWHDSILESLGKSWKVLEPRIGPLTDNFWTVSALFQLPSLGQNVLVIKDEKCILSGVYTYSHSYWPSFFICQDFAQKADYSLCGFFVKVLAQSWKILENLYSKTLFCKNLGKNPYRSKV